VLALTAYRRGNLGFRPGACARPGSPRLGGHQFRFLDVPPTDLVAKFETVSAPGFTPLPGPGATQSVSVGPNVDVSNEPGPQSETSIAINPSDQSQIVSGSNEIFRLPMRGWRGSARRSA